MASLAQSVRSGTPDSVANASDGNHNAEHHEDDIFKNLSMVRDNGSDNDDTNDDVRGDILEYTEQNSLESSPVKKVEPDYLQEAQSVQQTDIVLTKIVETSAATVENCVTNAKNLVTKCAIDAIERELLEEEKLQMGEENVQTNC